MQFPTKAILRLLVLAGLCLPVTAKADSIHWYQNLDQASLLAQETNKPMMIDFWADWCAPCKIMEQKVYSNSDFARAAERFVAVRIDFDKEPAIDRRLNVDKLPVLLFTDSYGGELFRYTGIIDAKPLTDLLRSLPADVSRFNQLNRILAGDKNNFDALVNMGQELRNHELYLASNEFYIRALRTPKAKSDPPSTESVLTQVGSNYLAVKAGKQAVEAFEKYLKLFPNSPSRGKWTLGLAQGYILTAKKDKARELLQKFVREHSSSPDSEQARKMLTEL